MNEDLKRYYQRNLAEYGPSAQGVGWKNKEAQAIRFEQLSKVFPRPEFSLNDLGCGSGDFVDFLRSKGIFGPYRGYDVMEDMIAAANSKYGQLPGVTFDIIGEPGQMEAADCTVASGIFNLRFGLDNETWLQYILDTLRVMDAKSRAGFAFNLLTMYSDPEYMKPELYYADPCFLFDFCKRNFSRNVALLHDYDQYDFTIIVRKEV